MWEMKASAKMPQFPGMPGTGTRAVMPATQVGSASKSELKATMPAKPPISKWLKSMNGVCCV